MSPYPDRIRQILLDAGDEVCDPVLELPDDDYKHFDFLVSYGWPRLFKPLPPIPAINLHISLLPWNRGADPNLWSWIDDTPKGVSIHQIDEGIDTGPIIIQYKLEHWGSEPTLATTYTRLQEHIEGLFRQSWQYIRKDWYQPTPQSRGGTYHSKSDRRKVEHLLTQGWNTPVKSLIGKAPPT